MYTKEQLADAKQALEKMEDGIRAAMPTLARTMREMEKMECQFQEMRTSVQKEIACGARRTKGNPV